VRNGSGHYTLKRNKAAAWIRFEEVIMRLVSAALVFAFANSLVAQEQGFVPLFNGKDLEGWEIKESKAKDEWTVKEGLLTGKAGSGWIATRKKYADFVLKVEWRIPENGNSGVFLRVPELKPKEAPHVAGLEVQILDDHGPLYKGKLQPWQFSGSLYYVAGPSKAVYKGAGQWNAFAITCKGDRITVEYNGAKVVDVDQGKEVKIASRPRHGFIGLQNHGSGVEFRNIMIKVLER
jgi:hypothetical protein